MAQNYKCYGGGPNSIGGYSCICNPPTYNIDGSIASWSNAPEAARACSGAAMVSPSGNSMPIQDKQTYEQKKGLGKRKVANRMRKNKKLSASGCGCGSSFTGDSKPCSCGRNPGGSCQCKNKTWQEPMGMGPDWGGSSAQTGGNASQPISMPVMAAASGNAQMERQWHEKIVIVIKDAHIVQMEM